MEIFWGQNPFLITFPHCSLIVFPHCIQYVSFIQTCFAWEFFLESNEKIRKNNMLDNTVRTKNLILELNFEKLRVSPIKQTIHACIHTYIYTYIHTYMHAFVCTISTSMRAITDTYIHTCMHTYVQYQHRWEPLQHKNSIQTENLLYWKAFFKIFIPSRSEPARNENISTHKWLPVSQLSLFWEFDFLWSCHWILFQFDSPVLLHFLGTEWSQKISRELNLESFSFLCNHYMMKTW